jgi:hypothetical protein
MQPVHLVAREAPLSLVLKRLADSLGFDVVYQSRSDPLITTDERLVATELVRRLAQNVNFSLEQARDARCAQGNRIAKVSVLLDTAGGSGTVVTARKPAPQTPEMARISQQGLSDYLTSHGNPDQPLEDLAVH